MRKWCGFGLSTSEEYSSTNREREGDFVHTWQMAGQGSYTPPNECDWTGLDVVA